MAEEAKRVFVSHTLIEEGGERWTLKLEDAAYYVARAKITTIVEAREMLVEMTHTFPDWSIFSRSSFEMVGEASGWVNLAQDLFVAFCQEVLEQDPAIKREMEKRSRQPERSARELARIKGVLKI